MHSRHCRRFTHGAGRKRHFPGDGIQQGARSRHVGGSGAQRHAVRAAREALPPAHFGYIATGADDDQTVARNHDAFSHYEIRVRRFNDISKLDTTTTVFGTKWSSPLYLSAVSS